MKREEIQKILNLLGLTLNFKENHRVSQDLELIKISDKDVVLEFEYQGNETLKGDLISALDFQIKQDKDDTEINEEYVPFLRKIRAILLTDERLKFSIKEDKEAFLNSIILGKFVVLKIKGFGKCKYKMFSPLSTEETTFFMNGDTYETIESSMKGDLGVYMLGGKKITVESVERVLLKEEVKGLSISPYYIDRASNKDKKYLKSLI